MKSRPHTAILGFADPNSLSLSLHPSQYPRLDPVAICLVVSSDGNHALLGSPRYASGRMLTCLAGFVEQGETLEEAAAREVMEEAGVEVGQIRILGSQPWPLGRSGEAPGRFPR